MNKKSGLDRFLDNLFEFCFWILKTLWDIAVELAMAIWKNQAPVTLLFGISGIIGLLFFFRIDRTILRVYDLAQYTPTENFRVIVHILFWLLPWFIWGIYQIGRKRQLNKKLLFVFKSAKIKSGLGLTPEFVSDIPLDMDSRKLRLAANGVALKDLRNNKERFEDGMGVAISKIEWGDDARRFLDIVYSFGRIPDFYVPEVITRYENFSFPVGCGTVEEVVVSLKKIPHYLVAGETGTGKSTFIRMAVEVLLANNELLDVYFLDFKGGIEAKALSSDARVEIITDFSDAANTVGKLSRVLTKRSKTMAGVAHDIDGYNRRQSDPEKRLRRILIVVDEVSEIMPRFGSGNKNEVQEINSGITRIARMGRAAGLHLIIGTQKPDAKNMETTIKANLSGILCFPVTHPTQSLLVLGDGRAADLNAAIRGRAIWKHGSYSEEVQTPFIDEAQIAKARKEADLYWKDKNVNSQKTQASPKESTAKNKEHGALEDVEQVSNNG